MKENKKATANNAATRSEKRTSTARPKNKRIKTLLPTALERLLAFGLTSLELSEVITCAYAGKLSSRQLVTLADIKRAHGSKFGFGSQRGCLTALLDCPDAAGGFQRYAPLTIKLFSDCAARKGNA